MSVFGLRASMAPAPLLALLSVLGPLQAGAASLALARDLDESLKERPVMKVVRLLQDMGAELQRELDDDKAVHEKLTCWCTANDQEKSKAIELGEAESAQLSASMDETTAKMVDLKAKRKATMDELYADRKALDTATALRMKENQNFHGSETDLLGAIDACKQAVIALSKHHPELAQVRAAARQLKVSRAPQLVAASGGLRVQQLDLLKGFLQQVDSASSFLAIPGFRGYAPQSGQIYGILKQMKADFEASLSDEQKAELKAKEQHEALKVAKKAEITSGEEAIETANVELADFSEKHAQAAQDFEDTQAQLDLDKTFLANLKSKCAASGEEYDARLKSRLDEIAAVEDTIKILNSDDAFDQFGKSVGMAFLQTSSTRGLEEHRQRAAAMAALQRGAAAAASSGPAATSRQLALLAASAQLDSFTKVKAAIDTMVTELKKQQADEVMHRDWCIDELGTNKRATEAAYDKKAALETSMADSKKTIASLISEIDSTKAASAEMQAQMKRASENREAESADFQQTVTDQRLTQVILAKALDRMKMVYAFLQRQDPGAPHIETSATHTDAGNGPARFTKYAQNSGGSRVVQMLEKVMAESKKMEDEAIQSEEDSQTAYESFMKDSNKSLTAYMTKVMNLSKALATTKAALLMGEQDFKQTMQQLEGLNSVLGDLHTSCDFLMKNFDARQAARAAEMDALKEAKAILSGMR